MLPSRNYLLGRWARCALTGGLPGLHPTQSHAISITSTLQLALSLSSPTGIGLLFTSAFYFCVPVFERVSACWCGARLFFFSGFLQPAYLSYTSLRCKLALLESHVVPDVHRNLKYILISFGGCPHNAPSTCSPEVLFRTIQISHHFFFIFFIAVKEGHFVSRYFCFIVFLSFPAQESRERHIEPRGTPIIYL